MNSSELILLTGGLGMLGATLYAASDVLMLAAKIDLREYPNLQRHAKLLSGTEKMAALPIRRIQWGGLLGVLSTPLVFAGIWLLYFGLAPANGWQVWPVVLLFGVGFVIAPFVHGSFIYLGEYVHALNRLPDSAQAVVIEMFQRHRQILIVSYGVVAVTLVAGSLWFSAAVALGGTRFPAWMAAVNPITLLIVWMIIRRAVPRVGDWLEGAGFNIAFLAYFACATVALQ